VAAVSVDPGSGRQVECGACQSSPPPFEASFIPYRYAPPMDHLVRQFKFSGRLEIAPLLGELLQRAIPLQARPDLLIPIPLHDKRLNERGYNQAMELARQLRRRTAVPCDDNALVRVRHTAQQTALNRNARRTNVAGAFGVQRGLHDLRIALIDDVVTTGATVAEAASVLLSAGAKRVDVWAVARTP
jgi:ComF family protein